MKPRKRKASSFVKYWDYQVLVLESVYADKSHFFHLILLHEGIMFTERIFCDVVCDSYGKSEENDKKYLDDGFNIIIVTFIHFFYPKTYQIVLVLFA